MRNASPPGRIASLLSRRKSVPTSRTPRLRRGVLLALAVAVAAAAAAVPIVSASASSSGTYLASRDGLGIQPGKIKHVWLIILENKSYDATFTGLNKNTYLWQTLPSQGVLLKNYYGTGHFSLDNYISMVSGQATQPDTQADCPYYDKFSGSIDTSGSLYNNRNYGQMASAQGPNAAAGSNGCVYPASVPTLFNQLDAADESWKGYAQDLGNPDASGPTHDAGTQYCGAPYATPGPTGSTAQPNPGSANATDQYVPKHFPFPWFESILQSGDCNSQHIANLFSPQRRPLPRPAERRRRLRRSAGSRRTTAATATTPSATGTTSRVASRTRTPQRNRSTTPADSIRPTSSSSTSSPRSRPRRPSRKAV